VVVVSWRSIGERVAAGGVLCGGLVVLLLVAALPATAATLESRFSINGGAQYSRYVRVAAGDDGWSPFFQPGVIVWDGGSIIGRSGTAPELDFVTQTLRQVPRTCESFKSITAAARIADMIAAAPYEVDAHYRPYGDLNVCVAHPGASDLRHGADPGAVYEAVRVFCQGRRAAGFSVVLMTLLPAVEPASYEASRQTYNALVRENWHEFADGLADIAADPRIGDAYDNLDQRYYASDGVHPNSAGGAVMASIAAPAVNALAWRSTACEMRIREAGTEWGAWRSYVARSTVGFTLGDGVRGVEAEYRDAGGTTVAFTDSIFLDTVRPQTKALRMVRVRRGKTATLPYRVTDPQPCGPTATVTIKVTRPSGAVVKQILRRRQTIGGRLTVAFICRLPRGTYRYVITARDTAGNPESVAGSALLKVR